jgi:hypothetical protein
MKERKRNAILWLARAGGILAIALFALFGGVSSAFAHDDDEVVTYGPNACTAVANLPAYQPAICVKHEVEQDDGVTETESTYSVQATADTVRLYFENTLRQNGWTVVKSKYNARKPEWKYTALKDGRKVSVEVKTLSPQRGGGTEFSIEEE